MRVVNGRLNGGICVIVHMDYECTELCCMQCWVILCLLLRVCERACNECLLMYRSEIELAWMQAVAHRLLDGLHLLEWMDLSS